jgi:protein-disulfide isomerase
MISRALAASALVLMPVSGATQTPTCDGLEPAARQRAAALLSSEHPYDCCDGTITECLHTEPVCHLAWRRAEAVCRRVAAGEDDETVRRALSRRARSMLPGLDSAQIELAEAPCVGPDDAPVTVVVFACARCPFCSKLVPELHAAVSDGPLAGSTRLCFKTFPIRGHPMSKEGGLAFMAAAAEGRFWPFALHAYNHFDDFCIDRLEEWADAAGLERFAELYPADTTRGALVESKKEGLRLGVDATPTVFLNHRRYVGELSVETLIDVIGEERERVTGDLYR